MPLGLAELGEKIEDQRNEVIRLAQVFAVERTCQREFQLVQAVLQLNALAEQVPDAVPDSTAEWYRLACRKIQGVLDGRL